MAIPLHIHESTGIDRFREVIIGGVPVPKGVLGEAGWFTLKDEDGGEFPVEGAPGAWWPDGSVKWLHLCGTVDLKGGAGNLFMLEPADRGPDSILEIARCGRGIHVKGGPLDIDILGESTECLSVRRAGSEEELLSGPGLSASAVFVGPGSDSPRSLDLRWGPEPPNVVAETASRVVVRRAGELVDKEGHALAELIVFIEVLMAAPQIGIQPVFIYLGDPECDLVASLELRVHTAIKGDACSYAFANERGRGYVDVVQPYDGGPRWPQARQVQLGSSFYRTDKRTGEEGAWVKAVEGSRSQGWCHLSGEQGGVTAATRYFWEEYPRSLAIDTDTGTIAFGLWPNEAEPLDLRRYSPTIYGQPVYEYCPRTAVDGKFPAGMGATGIAKAHELMLHFHEGDAQDAADRGLFFSRPCRVLPDPVHLAETKVLGHLAPAAPPRHQLAESKVTEFTDFVISERAVRGWYGQMDFGDLLMAYYSESDRWAFDDGGYAWINTEHLPDLGLWLSALRYGRQDWLEAAIEMSRHNRDVDTYHRGELKGHGTRHNVNHWGCADKEWRISMPLVRRLHYYLTGDPWTAETIRETVGVFQSYERTAKIAPSMTSSFAGLMVKWEMSGDPADGEAVRNMADLFARAIREDGMLTSQLHADLATGIGYPEGDEALGSYFFMNGFGGQHTLVEVAELLDHRPLSEAIERHVRYCLANESGGHAILLFMAHVWRRTGDPEIREAICESLDKMSGIGLGEIGGDGILDEPRHLALKSMTRRNKIACHIAGEVLHLTPYGLAVLDD